MEPSASYLKQLYPIFQVEELALPRNILYRFDNATSRYYYRFPDGEDEIAYMGATAATDILVRKGQGLYNWYASNGEMAHLMLRTLAEYGTLMHTEIALFERRGRSVIWADVEKSAVDAAMTRNLEFCAEEWLYHLPRNLAAWIQFCIEKGVKVLAVEYPVWSDTYKIATLVDVYCELTFNRKRVRAIINLKSNIQGEEDEDKTFYESQDCQLQIEKTLWKETNPDLPVDMVFNWSPNNWREDPNYTLKNWSEKTKWGEERLKASLPLLQYEFQPPKKTVVLRGEYVNGGDLRDCIQFVRMNVEKEAIRQMPLKVARENAANEKLNQELDLSVEKVVRVKPEPIPETQEELDRQDILLKVSSLVEGIYSGKKKSDTAGRDTLIQRAFRFQGKAIVETYAEVGKLSLEQLQAGMETLQNDVKSIQEATKGGR